MLSSWPLLPVSMVDTPSIMMLLNPPPPRRVVVPVTPGVSDVNDEKLRAVPIGRFCTSVVVTRNERSPLCDWMIGFSAVTVMVSAVPPTASVSSPRPTRSPPLTATPVRRRDLNPDIDTSMV